MLQTSIFEDEQMGDVTLPAIIFKDGKLIVPKKCVITAVFVAVSSDKEKVYKEFDANKEAETEIKTVEEEELEAMNLAKDMPIEDLKL